YVRQVEVQQQQVRPQAVHLIQGLAARVGLADQGEAWQALDVGAVQVGNPEVVIDHERPDHFATATRSGSLAVNTAPCSPATVTSPPLRRAASRASARPIPRRRLPVLALVLNPSTKTRSRSATGTPGPESCTRITSSWS